MAEICIIVAIDSERGIGKDNRLPWHLPADLKYFKSVTTGHPVIMGRKTYESIGKALPNRRNIVVSRQGDLRYSDAEVSNTLNAAIALASEGNDKVFIIGGADIFRQALPIADTIYLTRIHAAFEADTYLPQINENEWQEVKREDHGADEKNRVPYSFLIYKKLGNQ
ncbi:dihydrofolate reductase [Arcticibacter sp. MXS-1]|uniref:dihydrofolate reductase n=1 Tax=Arcticibacter sp. MXS-1 TaxID=3341726 RepID=UPI0035A82E30